MCIVYYIALLLWRELTAHFSCGLVVAYELGDLFMVAYASNICATSRELELREEKSSWR